MDVDKSFPVLPKNTNLTLNPGSPFSTSPTERPVFPWLCRWTDVQSVLGISDKTWGLIWGSMDVLMLCLNLPTSASKSFLLKAFTPLRMALLHRFLSLLEKEEEIIRLYIAMITQLSKKTEEKKVPHTQECCSPGCQLVQGPQIHMLFHHICSLIISSSWYFSVMKSILIHFQWTAFRLLSHISCTGRRMRIHR